MPGNYTGLKSKFPYETYLFLLTGSEVFLQIYFIIIGFRLMHLFIEMITSTLMLGEGRKY